MNSVLNPEAPEFYPHLTSFSQAGYTTVHKTIRSSNQLPIGASYELFKTFPDFHVVRCQLSENVVVQANQILVTELPGVKLKLHDNETNHEKVVDANDSVLDRVNIHIDTLSGANGPGGGVVRRSAGASWNQAPLITKIQVGSTMLIGAKNIPRPQLMFKEPVDNSENLWVPKISDKPNNIKPLALNIIYNDNGEALGYEHPYQVELDLYQPPPELLLPDAEAPPPPPPALEETPLTLVETPAQVDELVRHLATQAEMAVDLEHHSYRTYQGITCLIQISTPDGGDFIVDALAAREHLQKLNQIFTDPKKLKVFHGADSDILWLQRDFGVYVVGMFDTHRAARALALPALSLKSLLLHFCGVDTDKKFQLADWRIRPLPAELVQYARMDTHYLLHVWRCLKRQLLAAAAGQPHLLRGVFEDSRQLCNATYNKEVVRPDSHLQLYVRSCKSFNARQMAALQMLYKWRDTNARELDESTTYLLPNHMLVALAETLPREVQGVHAVCSPMPPFVKQHLIALHRMLRSKPVVSLRLVVRCNLMSSASSSYLKAGVLLGQCRELPLEPQLLRAPAAPPRASPARPLTYDVHDFAHYNDDETREINLERASQLFADSRGGCAPDVLVFAPSRAPLVHLVSDLNVDAELFIPPYDRYRKYRSLAQIEELKEFKEKEAKIAAISKGNELIKSQVLVKLQRAHLKAAGALDPPPPAPAPAPARADEEHAGKKQRKRKMPDKERKESADSKPPRGAPPARAPAARGRGRDPAQPTTSLYKNVDYGKFCDVAEKARKQPKMLNKKHK